MNDCLVTKLKGTVDNPNLPKLGILAVDVFSIANFTEQNSTITIYAGDKDIHVKVVSGGGYMGNSWATLSSDQLTEVIVPANGHKGIPVSDFNGRIEIDNKYYIEQLILGVNTSEVKSRFSIGDLANINYPNELTTLYVNISGAEGDIQNLKDYPNIDFWAVGNKLVTGDVTGLENTNINLIGTKCYGDFTSLLEHAAIDAPRILSVTDSGHDCVADFSKASDSVKICTLAIKDNKFNGLWKTTRPSSKTIITFQGYQYATNLWKFIDFGNDLDAMLINQAECEAAASNKHIVVNGNRTSASDAAIATLKSKGYNVTINGLPL